jgi:spore coat polysaccharide biosynthesis protein SpsF
MKKPKIVAIIQGRMAASRLPGKILCDLGGQPMLTRVVERVQRATTLDMVLVATTSDRSDDPVEIVCRARNYPLYRGDMLDVLNRYYQAALQSKADIIVRITADCPVIDAAVIDLVIKKFLQTGADFAANRLPPPWKRTFPIGLDVEVCTFIALERAWKEADQKFQREHVMPFIYEGIPVDAFDMTRTALQVSPRGFQVLLVNHLPDLGSKRWTVDTAEDLELMQRVYAHFEGRDDFTWLDVLALFEREPELVNINSNVAHKSAFDTDRRQPDGFTEDR